MILRCGNVVILATAQPDRNPEKISARMVVCVGFTKPISLMPLRKKPHVLTDPVLASIAPNSALRFAPPENPPNATGHLADCGRSLRMDSSAAASIARRHCVESNRGLIVASEARRTQYSARAGRRYHSASIGLVRLKSLVEVTTRIGQLRAGSKLTGNVNSARPRSGRGLPPFAPRCLETTSPPGSESPR